MCVLGMDFKRDLVHAIELNESVLDLDKDVKDIHLNIICEIRARLLEGNSLPDFLFQCSTLPLFVSPQH
jgi:hypothetical protein